MGRGDGVGKGPATGRSSATGDGFGEGSGDGSGKGDGFGAVATVGSYIEPITATSSFPVWRRSTTRAESEARSRMMSSSGGDTSAWYPSRRRVTYRSSMIISSGLTGLLIPKIAITARGGSGMGYERKDDDSMCSAQTMVMVVLPSGSCPQLMASTVLAVDSGTAATRRSTVKVTAANRSGSEPL